MKKQEYPRASRIQGQVRDAQRGMQRTEDFAGGV